MRKKVRESREVIEFKCQPIAALIGNPDKERRNTPSDTNGCRRGSPTSLAEDEKRARDRRIMAVARVAPARPTFTVRIVIVRTSWDLVPRLPRPAKPSKDSVTMVVDAEP